MKISQYFSDGGSPSGHRSNLMAAPKGPRCAMRRNCRHTSDASLAGQTFVEIAKWR
jgi:hypothetical protein